MIAIVLAAALTAEPQPPRVQWAIYHASWCQPCREAKRDFEKWLKNAGWRVSDEEIAHVRLVDIDGDSADEIEVVPTFRLLVDGKVVEQWISYPGRQYLARRYLEEHARLK